MYTEPSVLPRTSSQSAFWLGLRLSNYFSRSVPWLSSKLPSPTSSFHPRPRPSQWPLSAAPSPAPFARASSIRPQWPPPQARTPLSTSRHRWHNPPPRFLRPPHFFLWVSLCPWPFPSSSSNLYFLNLPSAPPDWIECSPPSFDLRSSKFKETGEADGSAIPPPYGTWPPSP